MGLFDFFKKKQAKLTDEQQKWNKMWALWIEGKVDPPYAQLMTYLSEVNNGGHAQYFDNLENTSDLQNEMAFLETILTVKHKNNLQKAYGAYLVLEEKEDERAANILERCDNVFYENEAEINRILEEYAAAIEQ
ncbi:MAG: hypothetical protein IJ452_01320 [Butyricicoccus sp.]|nr:hypothetical protein [Butyricicoccus sp.]MBQ8584907.1 hypothetical protein [Butyricicoccus sp.]